MDTENLAVTFLPGQAADRTVGDHHPLRRPDITRARAILGWEPVVGLEVGLARTIGYFREKV